MDIDKIWESGLQPVYDELPFPQSDYRAFTRQQIAQIVRDSKATMLLKIRQRLPISAPGSHISLDDLNAYLMNLEETLLNK